VIGEGLIENALDESAEELHDEIAEVLDIRAPKPAPEPEAAAAETAPKAGETEVA
jgi:hypothetical protein